MIDQFLLQEARQAHKNGDYHAARDLYQQVAYSYNDFTELEKEAFTREVAQLFETFNLVPKQYLLCLGLPHKFQQFP